ncbi:MAG: L-lactate dehydrogenase [Acidimicrobiia bacterium]
MDHLAIIGAGSVGTAIAFAALNGGVARRLSLHDLDGTKAQAEVLDLRHGLQFVRPTTIEGGDDVEVCAGADVVVITAGAKQRPGETRLDLVARNARLFRALIPPLVEVAPEAIILVVTNPVDVLTQLTAEITGRFDGTVLGSGTVLDSSRLRHLLSLRYCIAERHIHASVVGEHGDTETVLWSSATIGGSPLAEVETSDGTLLDPAARDAILDQVRNAAYEIIAGKGATSWGIAMATTQILEALDQASQAAVLPVTAPLDPALGLGTVCISLPRLVDASGAGRILPLSATDPEREALTASAAAVRDTFSGIS